MCFIYKLNILCYSNLQNLNRIVSVLAWWNRKLFTRNGDVQDSQPERGFVLGGFCPVVHTSSGDEVEY